MGRDQGVDRPLVQLIFLPARQAGRCLDPAVTDGELAH